MQAHTKEKVKAMIAYNNAVISALARIEANGNLNFQQECELDSARVALASLTAKEEPCEECGGSGIAEEPSDDGLGCGCCACCGTGKSGLYKAPPVAALTAEPVEYRVLGEHGRVTARRDTLKEAQKAVKHWNKGWTIQPVYSALPATAPQPVKRPATKCIGWVRDAIHEHDAKWIEAIRTAGYHVEEQ